jgi:hypothetical protein
MMQTLSDLDVVQAELAELGKMQQKEKTLASGTKMPAFYMAGQELMPKVAAKNQERILDLKAKEAGLAKTLGKQRSDVNANTGPGSRYQVWKAQLRKYALDEIQRIGREVKDPTEKKAAQDAVRGKYRSSTGENL